MVEKVTEKTEMTVLADKVNELVDEHSLATAIDALLNVLAWKIADGAGIANKPADEIIDELSKGLKEAVRQIKKWEQEDEEFRTAEHPEQGKMLQ